MLKLANAFSLNMLNTEVETHVLVTKRISKEEAKELLKEGFENYIGHKDIANVVSNELGLPVEMNEIISELPTNFDEIIYGIDFGYNNPTACLIGIRDNDIYVLCDSAEPQRIEELIRAGYYATPSDKDVKAGIDFLKRHKIYISERISKEEAKELLKEGFENYIGHKDVANVVSNELGINVEMSEKRPNLVLQPEDLVVVAQYIGPRLPEGATQLPENARIEYFTVQIIDWSINDNDEDLE